MIYFDVIVMPVKISKLKMQSHVIFVYEIVIQLRPSDMTAEAKWTGGLLIAG